MKTRSAFFFERRRQMRSPSWPSPELAPMHLQVNRMPKLEEFSLSTLTLGTGTPPPDTPVLANWSKVPGSSTGS